MAIEERDQARIFRVVVNHEEQYSIWPASKPAPSGWKELNTGTKEECLAYIKAVWVDMRPASLRTKLDAARSACLPVQPAEKSKHPATKVKKKAAAASARASVPKEASKAKAKPATLKK